MAKKNKRKSPYRKLVIYGMYVALLVLLIALIVTQRGSVQIAWQAAAHAQVGWLIAGFVGMLLTIPCAAAVYMNLSPRPLPFIRTVIVQAAGLFVNKLLPAGSGAIATSFVYLRAQRLTPITAGAVVTTNNLLGLAGHSLLLAVLLLVNPHGLSDVLLPRVSLWWLALAAVIVGLSLVVLHTRLQIKFHGIISQIKPVVAGRWIHLLAALGFSVCITLGYAFALFAATRSLGIELSFVDIMIALSFSVIGTSIVPVPGGIGAAEAGVYLGLVAEHVPIETAIAAAVLFRLVSFWLPLLVGAVSFVAAIRLGFLSRSPKTGR